MQKRVLSLLLALCLLNAFIPAVVHATTSQKEDFINRIHSGFQAIADGDYNYACDIFGFSSDLSKASFNISKDCVSNSSLTILYATVSKASVKEAAGVMSATVTLYVQQDATEHTFGYLQKWPIGVYSMDFIMEMKNGAISIPEHILLDGALTSGLTAVYLPGQTENSLVVRDAPADFPSPFIYHSPASFLTELWLILQSYDLESRKAIFWGYGIEPVGEPTKVPPPGEPLNIEWETMTIAVGGTHSLAIKDDGSLWA
ncbi:MAG: hypothetical protein FWG53_00725 [Clostridiales bacterium]|nr:hypothetical protein [Clostridiales bacterium]